MGFRGDLIFLVSGALLATTVALFFAGVISYPYGCLALSLIVVLRLGYLMNKTRKHGGKRDNFNA